MSRPDLHTLWPRILGPRSVIWVNAIVVALFVMTTAAAEGNPPKKEKSERAAATSARSTAPGDVSEFQRAARGSRKVQETAFTNDDLERMFGPPTPESEAEPVAAPVETATETPGAAGEGAAAEKTPLELMAEQEQARLQKERDIAAATSKIEQLRKKVEELDERARAVRNPLLPRPSVPKEEQGEWDKLGASDRAARTDAEISAARDELSKAEGELSRLRGSNP